MLPDCPAAIAEVRPPVTFVTYSISR